MTKRKCFKASDLEKLADAESFQHPSEGPLCAGDVVHHNSGGPDMMVVEYDGQDRVIVAWYNDDGELQEDSFPRPCLHRVALV